MAASAAWSSGRLGRRDVRRVRARAGRRPSSPPSRSRPAGQAGRLERGDREERGRRLAVRAGDPDRADRLRRVAVPPPGRPGQGRRATPIRRPAAARSRTRAARRWPRPRRHAAAPGDEVVAVDMEPRDRDEQAARRGPTRESSVTPLTSTSARPAAPIGRSSRRAPRTRSAVRRRAMSSAMRARRRAARPRRCGRRRWARSRPAPPPHHAPGPGGRAPGRRSARPARRAPGRPRGATQVAPNERLCSYRPKVGSPSPRLASRAGHVDAAEVHLGPPFREGELDRPPAQEVHRARVVVPPLGAVAGVGGREATAVAVQDEAAEDVAVRRALARLEVDEVAGGERPGPPGHELARPPEPEAAPVAGGAQQLVETAQGGLRRLVAAMAPSTPRHPARGPSAGRRPRPARHAGSAGASPSRSRPSRPRRRRPRAARAPCGGARAGSRRSPRKPAASEGAAVARDRPPATSGSAATTSTPRRLEVRGRGRQRRPDLARPSRRPTTAGPARPGPRGRYADPPPTSGQPRTSASARASPTARNRGRQPCAARCSAQARDWRTCPPGASTAPGVPAVERVAGQLVDAHRVTRRPPASPA